MIIVAESATGGAGLRESWERLLAPSELSEQERESVKLHHRENEQLGTSTHIVIGLIAVALVSVLFVLNELTVIELRGSELIAIAVGAVLAPLVFVDPRHSLFVIALVSPISPERDFGMGPLRLQDPLIGLMILGTLVALARGKLLLPKLTFKWPILLYLVYAVLATLLGIILSILSDAKPPNFFYALKLVQYAALALCTGLVIRNRKDVVILATCMVLGAVIVVAQLNPGEATSSGRVTGGIFDEQANVLALYLCLAFCLVLGLFDRTRDGLGIFLMLLLVAVIGFAILLTKSRSGYAGLGLTLIIGMFVMKKRLLAIIALIATVPVFLIRTDILARLSSLQAVVGLQYDSSYASRLRAYGIIWNRIGKQWNTLVFGEGWGVEPLSWADTQWGIELQYGGVIGFAIALFMISATLIFALKLWRKLRRDEGILGSVVTAGAMAIPAAVLATFGLTNWTTIRCAEFLFLMIGMLIAVDRVRKIESVTEGKDYTGPRVPWKLDH